MSNQNDRKVNWLEQHLPEGLPVSAMWLTKKGYSGSLRTQYVTAGRLQQPARSVFIRPRGKLTWEQTIISLQNLLEIPILVGGRTALELQGHGHYLSQHEKSVHLYGKEEAPAWLFKLSLDIEFKFHKSSRVFRNDPITRGLGSINWNIGGGANASPETQSIEQLGPWDWPLTLSTPERAVLELLDELPDHETFHQADKLIEGLVNLRPGRLQKLLEDCHNVKVKRLFFFFAERHQPAWLKHLDRTRIDLGKGKRMLVRGGRLDAKYGITVPGDLDAVS